MSAVSETYIEPSAIALYDYEPTAIDDLSFNVSEALLAMLWNVLMALDEYSSPSHFE